MACLCSSSHLAVGLDGGVDAGGECFSFYDFVFKLIRRPADFVWTLRRDGGYRFLELRAFLPHRFVNCATATFRSALYDFLLLRTKLTVVSAKDEPSVFHQSPSKDRA